MDSQIFWYPAWIVAGFCILIVIMLVLDLGIFNKKSHQISNREALMTSILWISLAMMFSAVVYATKGSDAFAQFQAAYWVEKALSVDNLFVFILVFATFNIPREYQHRVLFYGVLWAIIFRAIFIFLGIEVINKTYIDPNFFPSFFGITDKKGLNPIMFAFGFFLIYSGVKSWLDHGSEPTDVKNTFSYRLIGKFFTISPELNKDRFFIIKNGIKMATPLFVALLLIELMDLVFAIDSIPAIFSIAPNDPFILYTSNIFAILGLRSLYFLLANSLHIFSKLHYGLAIILSFIGIKMIVMPWYHFEKMYSLGFIALTLISTIIWSLYSNQKSVEKIIDNTINE